jgi:ComF family protein
MRPMPALHIQSYVWLRRLTDALIEPIDTATRLNIAPPVDPGAQQAIPMAPCPRCAHSAPKVTVTPDGCPQCFKLKFPWATVTRLHDYRGPIIGAVHAMKYHGRWPLAQKLAGKLAIRVQRRNLLDPQTLVTPVPMHWLRRLSRGYNHAHVIAQSVASSLNLPCLPLLKRTRNNPAQVGLSRADRLENLKNAIAPLPIDLTGRTILLIDDVTTTGATLQACAKALKQAGASRIHIAVIAVASPGH